MYTFGNVHLCSAPQLLHILKVNMLVAGMGEERGGGRRRGESERERVGERQ